jgi:hypothetical protein
MAFRLDFGDGKGTTMRFGERIRRGAFFVGLATLTGAAAAVLSAGSPPSSAPQGKVDRTDLIVHEWGTFLGMSGSDGASLDGMYHEEHSLPAFVHSRSRDQLRLPFVFLKGETPVIYFYTQTRQRVRVGVGFPHGIWTQWFPQALLVNPPLAQHAETPDRLKDGRICWQAEVIPASAIKPAIGKSLENKRRPEIELPATSSDALWNYARDVDAAYVTTSDATKEKAPAEYEKFLFYRGLGEARLPLHFDSSQNGTLSLDREATLGDGVRQVFVIRVENGRAAYRFFPAVRPGERVHDAIPSMTQARAMPDFTRAIGDELAAGLVKSGLFPKEARAMVNTWTASYFQTDGVRVLFVLPQSWTDAFIPMTVSPTPAQIVRVMVGRVELLTADREKLAEDAVRNLASGDVAKCEDAFQFLHDQGRYVEPIVRRVLKTTTDDEVRTVCRRLLLTDFLTELRAAVHNAADGTRLTVDPFILRAQLARLLREVGSDAEARALGAAVLADVKRFPLAPDQTLADNPAALEIRAAAIEAMGDDRKAAAVYARRIEIQIKSCKGGLDPGTIPGLRDWWVGRAYGQCLRRASQAASTITGLENYLGAHPTSTCSDDWTSRILLAYLLEAQGNSARALAEWAALAAKPKPDQAAAAPALKPDDPGQTGT